MCIYCDILKNKQMEVLQSWLDNYKTDNDACQNLIRFFVSLAHKCHIATPDFGADIFDAVMETIRTNLKLDVPNWTIIIKDIKYYIETENLH